MRLFVRVIFHVKHDVLLTASNKSLWLPNNIHRDTLCFAYKYAHIRAIVTCLACRVIARMPVHSPFSVFSRGGSHIVNIGIETTAKAHVSL